MDTAAGKEREIHIRISVGRRELAGFAAMAILCLSAMDLSTESLTLTTYYPAPYGAYKELRATKNAYFAYVPTGTPANPKVGIGTDSPSTILTVNGDITGDKLVDSSDSQYFLDPGEAATSAMIAGSVGLGVTPAGNAKLQTGSGYIRLADNTCTLTNMNDGGWAMCSGGKYATWIPGIYQEGSMWQTSFEVIDLGGPVQTGAGAGGNITLPQRKLHRIHNGRFYCCDE